MDTQNVEFFFCLAVWARVPFELETRRGPRRAKDPVQKSVSAFIGQPHLSEPVCIRGYNPHDESMIG